MSKHAQLRRDITRDDDRTIACLVSALRTLEERRRASVGIPHSVVHFLGSLDRRLIEEERRYVAVVFAACRTRREEMTMEIVERLGVARGAAIAGIRAHLESTATGCVDLAAPRAVCEYLERLRSSVLEKVALVGPWASGGA